MILTIYFKGIIHTYMKIFLLIYVLIENFCEDFIKANFHKIVYIMSDR